MAQQQGLNMRRTNASSNLLQENRLLASKNVAANNFRPVPTTTSTAATRRFGTVVNKAVSGPVAAASKVGGKAKASVKPVLRDNVGAENTATVLSKKPSTTVLLRAGGTEKSVNVPSTVLASRKSLGGSKIPRIGRPSIMPRLSSPNTGFSTFILPPGVEDIDDDDGANVLLATDYVNDIYGYLRELEVQQSVKSNFLQIQREMTPKMRSVLVDWLINVHHQFKLLPETLYMGISIMDRFFQREMVSKDKIQLVGVTAFFIASKFEEIYPPDLMDFVVICDQLYSKKEIVKMEMVVLRALKFELGRPLPLHFLRRNSKAAHADPKIHAMAKYIMEVTLLDHEISAWKPSLLAAAALNVTLKALNSKLDDVWTKTLAFYSNYSEDEIEPFAAKVCQVLRKIENSRFQNCRKKYGSTRLQEISKCPALQSQLIDEMAAQAIN